MFAYRNHTPLIAVVFVVLTVMLTWPLPARLTTSVPGDYGDPLLVSWIMSWVAQQVTAGLTNPMALRTFWNAPIFFSEPNTLALSEHFIPQTLLVLPVYWATWQPILAYNLAFLLSFVLTGVATALLTRALTGTLVAGVLAGVVAAFNEFRLVWEVARLQTLSIFWFPFVLLGIHSYLVTGRRRSLVATGIAWIGLNLSSVYYLAYCQPFIAVFALGEIVRFQRAHDRRVWLDLAATAAVTAALTAPFLIPYVEMQRRLGFERTEQEIVALSATLDHYRAALPKLWVPVSLSGLAILVAAASQLRRRRSAVGPAFPALLVLVLASAVILTVWLSLGPIVRAGGRTLDVPAVYSALTRLPGFEGLRVPTRFIALFFVFLGMLAGIGAATVSRAWPRLGAIVAGCAMCVFLWQGRDQRVTLDRALPSHGLAAVPAYLTPTARLPRIYRVVESLPAKVILAEFPFGDPWFDVRYMFFAASHRRPLVNGYSGVIPPSYRVRQAALANPLRDPFRARAGLIDATHVIVHKASWTDGTGEAIEEWLTREGATLVSQMEGAVLYQLAHVAPANAGAR